MLAQLLINVQAFVLTLWCSTSAGSRSIFLLQPQDAADAGHPSGGEVGGGARRAAASGAPEALRDRGWVDSGGRWMGWVGRLGRSQGWVPGVVGWVDGWVDDFFRGEWLVMVRHPDHHHGGAKVGFVYQQVIVNVYGEIGRAHV